MGGGAHSVGQGLTVTAAPTPDPHIPSVSLVYGVRHPQCRPRAYCDVCAYPQTVAPRPARGERVIDWRRGPTDTVGLSRHWVQPTLRSGVERERESRTRGRRGLSQLAFTVVGLADTVGGLTPQHIAPGRRAAENR